MIYLCWSGTEKAAIEFIGLSTHIPTFRLKVHAIEKKKGIMSFMNFSLNKHLSKIFIALGIVNQLIYLAS